MFRSQTDHHQGDTIFLLTSVTNILDIYNILNLVTEVKRNIVSP
jgi:hypothetical protein